MPEIDDADCRPVVRYGYVDVVFELFGLLDSCQRAVFESGERVIRSGKGWCVDVGKFAYFNRDIRVSIRDQIRRIKHFFFEAGDNGIFDGLENSVSRPQPKLETGLS